MRSLFKSFMVGFWRGVGQGLAIAVGVVIVAVILKTCGLPT